MKKKTIKNNNTNIKSIAYNLSEWYDLGNTMSYFDTILNEVVDNDEGKIIAFDIRDVVYTLNENIAFKRTSGDFYSIDSDFIDGSASPMLIGKREMGTYTVMNEINGTYSDIYFYNTKKNENPNDNQDLKLSFVAGNNPDKFNESPYFEVNQVLDENLSPTLSFNIVNEYDINILSNTGDVIINEIVMPKQNNMDNVYLFVDGTDSNDNIVLKWDNISENFTQSVYGDGVTEINFDGSVNINNYPLEFTDNRKTNISIGNLKKGEILKNYSITEILRRILYTYLPPTCRLKFIDNNSVKNGIGISYAEVGTKPDEIKIKYEINKKTDNIISIGLVNMYPISLPPIIDDSFTKVDGIVSPIIQTGGIIIPNYEYDFTLNLFDGTEIANDMIKLMGIYPIYYKLTNDVINDPVEDLNKLIDYKSDIDLYFSGNGKIYFSYPSEYGTLSEINDGSSNILSDFIYNIGYYITDRWSKEYYQYESNATMSFSNITKITFKF